MKKFIVTDPCYILPNNIWDECCKEFDIQDDTMYERFDNKVQEELRKFSGTEKAWAGSTGIGDWSNTLNAVSSDIKIIESDFGADAGMVCCVELTPSVENSLMEKYERLIGAIFEVESEAEVTCEIDQSDKNWTIVRILDNENLVAISDDYDGEEYYDDDSFEEDEEEE